MSVFARLFFPTNLYKDIMLFLSALVLFQISTLQISANGVFFQIIAFDEFLDISLRSVFIEKNFCSFVIVSVVSSWTEKCTKLD